MNILITGASGFVGQKLVEHLKRQPFINHQPITTLFLFDQSFTEIAKQSPNNGDLDIQHLQGNLTDHLWLDQCVAGKEISVIFHLASIPGGTAETNYTLANAVNLDATRKLLELGKERVDQGQTAPIFVFASSIAVFGHLPAFKQAKQTISDDTLAHPELTYGVHKRIGELLIEDFSRRGWIDGRSLRLPGVLARPAAKTGQLSSFLSNIIHELGAGNPFICPMSEEATTWASSRPNIVENLIRAAELTKDQVSIRRTYILPTHCFTMGELVKTIGQVYDIDTQPLITYQPDPSIERLFGEYPHIDTNRAEQTGFKADITLSELVKQAVT